MLYNFSWVIPYKLAGSNMPGRRVVFGNHIKILPIDIYKDLIILKEEREIQVIASVVEELPKDFAYLVENSAMEHLFFPCFDYGAPQDMNKFRQFVNIIIERMNDNKPVCVHCKAGVGRTGLTLACILGTYLKLNADNAVAELKRVRPNSIESKEQMEFIKEFLK